MGIQWLLSLGSIIWNFSSLTMQFEYLGQSYTLQRMFKGACNYFQVVNSLSVLILLGMALVPYC